MTLCTYVWFETDKSLEEVYAVVAPLIEGDAYGSDKKPLQKRETQGDTGRHRETQGEIGHDNYRESLNSLSGQGYTAWYSSVRGTFPILPESEQGTMEFHVKDRSLIGTPRKWTRVTLDTSYGFSDPENGMYGAGHLHHKIIGQFMSVFGEDNVFWSNEFHDTISQGWRGPLLAER